VGSGRVRSAHDGVLAFRYLAAMGVYRRSFIRVSGGGVRELAQHVAKGRVFDCGVYSRLDQSNAGDFDDRISHSTWLTIRLGHGSMLLASAFS